MEIKLSILIATMPARKQQFETVFNSLCAQGSFPDVEVITDNSMEYNIGVKRNKLLQLAKGDYVTFIDDDDHISENYILLILAAICYKPDCIGMTGTITTNGANERQWFISNKYNKWFEINGCYYRTPNHISPVRREHALAAGFPEIAFGEDAEYSRRLLPMMKKEFFIDMPLYHYDYHDKK